MNQNCILIKDVAEKKLKRMALEIAEQLNNDETLLVLIGILNSGIVIAEKISKLLQPLLGMDIKVISCTLNKKSASDVLYSEEINFNNVNVIVVDDVINTGRTLLNALKPLSDFHPKIIQTLCLVERMHKTFPIKPDYVGLSVATTLQEHIHVEVKDGEVAGAYLI